TSASSMPTSSRPSSAGARCCMPAAGSSSSPPNPPFRTGSSRAVSLPAMRVLRSPAVAGLTAVGLVLRILAAAGHSAHVSADQRAYSLLGIGISEHGHYAAAGLKGQFHWPPGAPFLFALANLVHPAHHVSSVNPHVPAAYVAQVIVGTLTIPAAAWVAHQAAGRWA